MNAIVFFVIVIVIDLVLKSLRDKRRLEQAKDKRKQRLEKNINSTVDKVEDKRKTSGDRLKDREFRSEKNILSYDKYEKTDHSRKYGSDENVVDYEKYEKTYNKKYKDLRKSQIYKEDMDSSGKEKENSQLKKELLRGVIYSEILGEPKSIKNSKRGM